MFLMDIAQSDNADRLLRDLAMLKDDALEAADEAVRATNPRPGRPMRCPTMDGSRWKHPSYHRRARAWMPRGLLLTATFTVATGPSEVKVIEHVRLALAQGGPLLEYVSKDPDALTAALITRWSPGHAPISAARLCHLVFRGFYTASDEAPPIDTDVAPEIYNQKVSYRLHKPITPPSHAPYLVKGQPAPLPLVGSLFASIAFNPASALYRSQDKATPASSDQLPTPLLPEPPKLCFTIPELALQVKPAATHPTPPESPTPAAGSPPSSPSQSGEPFVPDHNVSAYATDYAQLSDRYDAQQQVVRIAQEDPESLKCDLNMLRTQRDNALQQVQRSAAAQRQAEAVQLNGFIRSLPPRLSIATRVHGPHCTPLAFASAVRSAVPALFPLPPPGPSSWPSCQSSSPPPCSPRPRCLTMMTWLVCSGRLCLSPRPPRMRPTYPLLSRPRFRNPGQLPHSGPRVLLSSHHHRHLPLLTPRRPPLRSGSPRSHRHVRTKLPTPSTSRCCAITARAPAPSRSPRFGNNGHGSTATH